MKLNKRKPLCAAIACAAMALAASAPALAACMTDTEVSALFYAYNRSEPAVNPENLSTADGECSRAKLNRMLALQLGAPVGYKAGLTNPAVQKRFNADAPVWGTLYGPMLLENGARVPANFGARALFEADLLVRVSSDTINQARSPRDVMAGIDQVIPFIELPDLTVQAPPKLGGPGISAINVGARFGVAGKPIGVPTFRGERYAMLDALRDMTVILTDGAGTELNRGKGSDVLEHPLIAVVWLAEALAKQGLAMKPGELISLGSFSPLSPPKSGLKVTATYHGLPGALPVSVTFK